MRIKRVYNFFVGLPSLLFTFYPVTTPPISSSRKIKIVSQGFLFPNTRYDVQMAFKKHSAAVYAFSVVFLLP